VISVFNYGAGNLRSVENTLGAIGAQYELVTSAEHLRLATKVILPGVGHFGQMMRALDELQVRTALIETIRAGVPFLGICLGMQALFTSSEEAPEERGLGIFEGTVRRFQGEMRIPHMGWNQVEPSPQNRSRLLGGTQQEPFVYFANSYYCPVINATSGICNYGGIGFTAMLDQDNISGVQFHPEKSGSVGLRIVKNFVES
jgi:imidazole glycerol phosphate synthase glutamine amidotransferase subunit